MFPRGKSYRLCALRCKFPVKTFFRNYVPQYHQYSNGKKKNYKRYYFFWGLG